MEKILSFPFTLALTVSGILTTCVGIPLTAPAIPEMLNPAPHQTNITNVTNNYITSTDKPTTNPKVNTDEKLASIIANYADTHPGTYSVSITELNTNQTHTTYNADIPTITASTYKTYVAYSTIKQIEAGNLTWETPTLLGPTVDTCFTIMLTESNNECAETLLDTLTFPQVQQDAADIGATDTHFEPYNIHSTANNLTLLLTKLATSQLPISETNQTKWLNTMQENIYRQGIPEGINNANTNSEPIIVADKVGFQDNLLHDTAIIYSPKGSYVLTILTTDATWENIAELANLIETNRPL